MPRYEDRDLAKFAKEYEAIGAKIKRLQALQSQRKKKIIEELEARGTKAVEVAGIRVTKVQSERVEYDYDSIAHELPKEKRRLIMKRVVDPDMLSRAVQSGEIDAEELDRHSSIRLNKPYISVSGAE